MCAPATPQCEARSVNSLISFSMAIPWQSDVVSKQWTSPSIPVNRRYSTTAAVRYRGSTVLPRSAVKEKVHGLQTARMLSGGGTVFS